MDFHHLLSHLCFRQKPLHLQLYFLKEQGFRHAWVSKALEEWEAECRSEAKRLAKAQRFGVFFWTHQVKIRSSLYESTTCGHRMLPTQSQAISLHLCHTPKAILTLKGGTTVGLAIQSSAQRNHILDRLYSLDLIGYCCVARIFCCYCHFCVRTLKPTYVFTSHLKRIVYFCLLWSNKQHEHVTGIWLMHI